MENCFFKVLKGTVDNENLEKFDVLTIKVPAYEFNTSDPLGKNALYFGSDIPGKYITVKGTKNFMNQSGEDSGTNEMSTSSLTSTLTIFPNTAGDTIEVSSKYNITRLSFINSSTVLDLSKLSYIPLTTLIARYGVSGKVEDFNILSQTLTSVELLGWNSGLCEIDEFAETIKDKVTSIYINGSVVTGKISDFGKCTLLTKLWCNADNQDVDTVENLIVSFISNGKTTGSLNFLAKNTKVTFNGASVLGGSATLSWEPASTSGQTRVTYNNVTITIDNATGNKVS